MTNLLSCMSGTVRSSKMESHRWFWLEAVGPDKSHPHLAMRITTRAGARNLLRMRRICKIKQRRQVCRRSPCASWAPSMVSMRLAIQID